MLDLTLTMQKCVEEKRARELSASGGWPRTVRLRRVEAYLTVREILPETSRGADGAPALGLYHLVAVLGLALPRILAGEKIGKAELALLAHDGLCRDCTECNYPKCPIGKST